MIKASHAGIGLILAVWAFSSSPSASAQLAPPPPPGSSTPPTAAMMMNPYLNPYMNPLLNPAAANQKLGVGNSLLYLYSAQAAQGGIGSGRLSNATGRPPASARKKAENMPNSASVPGGGASRYFNAGGAAGRTNNSGRYYNQRAGHFQNTRN